MECSYNKSGIQLFNHYSSNSLSIGVQLQLTAKNDDYAKRAVAMADFEASKQLADGGFEGGRGKGKPVTFNTGQVLYGLCRTYKETKEKKYKDAAIKAADFLLSTMNRHGCFMKHLYKDHIHTYKTRVAWALLYAYDITKEKKYEKAAIQNAQWALTQQLSNGFYKNSAFYPGQEPLVHTIAYTIQGMLEIGLITDTKEFIDSAKKAAEKMIELQRKDGSLQGSFNENWKSSVSWSCLTGNAQMSICWQKLYLKTKEEKFLDAAKKANEYNKKTQILDSKNPGIRGGIAGAYPLYGWYAPFCYINWGAKFFADALMLEDDPEIADKIDG